MGNIQHSTSNIERTVNDGTRLPAQTVELLHRLIGGDPHVEGMVLRFIADRYGVKNLIQLPAQVASEIIRRPADFLRAAKDHCEPELLAEGRRFSMG